MSASKPTVFVVDDDALVRRSLEMLIDSMGWQAESFGSGKEFLSRPRLLEPSCLVLDLRLPDLLGLDVQRLVSDREEMPVIFLSGFGDVPTTADAMKAGAMEFLTKPFIPQRLITAIGAAIARSRAELARAAELRRLRDCYESLSRREQEVLALVITGRLNKQVGGELGISEITVKAHRGKLMRKMHAGSVCDLVRMAERLRVEPTLTC